MAARGRIAKVNQVVMCLAVLGLSGVNAGCEEECERSLVVGTLHSAAFTHINLRNLAFKLDEPTKLSFVTSGGRCFSFGETTLEYVDSFPLTEEPAVVIIPYGSSPVAVGGGHRMLDHRTAGGRWRLRGGRAADATA